MPVLALAPAAATAFWGAIGAGAVAGSGIYGAHKQGSAAEKSAKLQTDAANRAALLEKQAADEALAFQREEAARSYASEEAARRGNYDQWRDREERLSAGGESVGLPRRTISDYVPISPTDSSAGSGTTTGAGMPDRPSDLQAALDVANKTAYGYQKHTDPNYWSALWTKDPEYAFRRMLGEGAGPSDAPKMGPYAGTSTAAKKTASTITPYGTIGDLAVPAWRRRSPRTPALTPGSVADYAVGRY